MKKMFNVYVRVFIFLLPVFFLPVLNNSFGLGKNALLVLSAAVGLLLWVLGRVIEKKDSMKISGIFGLVSLAMIWSAVSFWRLPLGIKTNSLMFPVGFGTVMGLFAWLFLWVQSGGSEEREKQLKWLTASGILVGVVGLVTFLIPEAKLPIVWPKDNPMLSISKGWSLTGSLIAEVTMLAFLASVWVTRVVKKVKEGSYIIEAVMAGVLILSLGVSAYKIISTGWSVLDYTSSWIIAAETFKRSAIFGVGIGNYSQAFSLFRPETFNLTQFWTASFGSAGMGVLHIWTEMGIVGLVLAALIVMKLLRSSKGTSLIVNGLLVALVLVLPLNFISLFLLTWVLAGAFDRKKIGLVLKVGERGFNAAPAMLGVLILGALAWSGIVYGKMLSGDISLRTSFVKAAANDGIGTYNEQVKAMGMNPNMGEYRRIYSQTNLALAQSILSNEEISDEDKERASVLVQQAVREAKAAIALDNLNPWYWSNLAAIYRNLIGVVDGAADWSVQAYQQAIALDPASSELKLEFGSLLYAAENYEAADRIFEEAVRVKQDYANAWYNWAYTAKKMDRIGDAVQRLSQAVALVPKDSGDYEKANKELEEWNKELQEAIKKQEAMNKEAAAKQTKEAETLKTAEPLPSTSPEEKVDVVEEELEPPQTPVNQLEEKDNEGQTTTVTPNP